MLDANSAEFHSRIQTLTGVLTRRLDLVESDPSVLIAAMVRVTVLTIATELHHLDPADVRRQAFKLFRKELLGVQERLALVKATESKANDA